MGRSLNEASKEVDVPGAVPGSLFLLVLIRRLAVWKDVSLTASKLFQDPGDGMVFFVTTTNGQLRRVHRDGAVLHPNLYGMNFDAGMCIMVNS